MSPIVTLVGVLANLMVRMLVSASVAASPLIVASSVAEAGDNYAYGSVPPVNSVDIPRAADDIPRAADLDSSQPLSTRATAGQQRWRTSPQMRVAAKTGADDVLNGVRLRAQLTGQEISGGHAFQKHVIDKAEFRHRDALAVRVAHRGRGRERADAELSNGRTAYWRDGTIVIRNPHAADGGTAFRPTHGYDYFLSVP